MAAIQQFGDEFHARILSALPDPLLVADAEGRIIYANQRAERFFGFSALELQTQLIRHRLPDWFTLASAQETTEMLVEIRGGARFTVDGSVVLVKAERGLLAIVSLRDSRQSTARLADMVEERDRLRRRLLDLKEHNEDFRSELNDAARLLESYLPSRDVTFERVEVAWTFSPCKTLGGDMIKLHKLSESRILFCILDVSGHGIPAALLSVGLAQSLAPLRNRGGIITDASGGFRSPEEVVSILNKNHRVLQEAGQFVTLLYGILDVQTRCLRYVCAGHPHPILFSQGRAAEIDGPINLPIGVVATFPYQETVAVLRPGDLLLMITDGVTETRNSSGELYDEDRLKELFLGLDQHSLPHMLEKLRTSLNEFRGSDIQNDDITALAIRLHSDA